MSSHPLFHAILEAVHPKDMFKLVCLSFSVFATLIWLEILGSLSYPQRQQLLHQPHAIKSLTFLDMLRKYIPSGLDFWENVAYDGLCILLIFGLGMIRESHFLQMHWCLVLDAQGSIKELVTRMSNPLYSDPPKSNVVQWLCSRNSTDMANLYISRLKRTSRYYMEHCPNKEHVFQQSEWQEGWRKHEHIALANLGKASFVQAVCGAPRVC